MRLERPPLRSRRRGSFSTGTLALSAFGLQLPPGLLNVDLIAHVFQTLNALPFWNERNASALFEGVVIGSE